MTVLATIPSPTQNQIQIFGFSLRAYALCILAGILLAIWLSGRRWIARGGKQGEILDLALWAVPFGIIGGRLYHVISTPQPYFGEGGDPIKALYIWEGGLGIWGAIALGAVGAIIAAKRQGLRMTSVADTVAPGIVLAQAVGRLGNWFNNELYGGPDDGPFGLEIHDLDANGIARTDPATGEPLVVGTFQPTFLYELVWCTVVGLALLWIDKRFRIGRGRLFAMYVALYCLGRFFIEQMRTDFAVHVLGLRINVWTALLVGLAAVAYLIIVKGGREATPYVDDRPAFVDADGTPTSGRHFDSGSSVAVAQYKRPERVEGAPATEDERSGDAGSLDSDATDDATTDNAATTMDADDADDAATTMDADDAEPDAGATPTTRD